MEHENLNNQETAQLGIGDVSGRQPYFKLSRNDYGKPFLFYKPSKGEQGKYGCWMPIDEEFYKEFDEMQKAACR